MYRAKQEGKNAYRFFTASMSERARERMLLQSSLRRAVEAGEFEMYYQPVVHGGGAPRASRPSSAGAIPRRGSCLRPISFPRPRRAA